MTATALLEKNPDADEEEVKEALAGNMCRCTGYAGILRAVKRYGRHADCECEKSREGASPGAGGHDAVACHTRLAAADGVAASCGEPQPLMDALREFSVLAALGLADANENELSALGISAHSQAAAEECG